MLPGPTIIKRCLNCSALVKEYTIVSGNTFDAIFWTDGKRDAPMLPDQPWLAKCPHCQTLIWIDEQDEVAEVEPLWENEKYMEAKSYSLPNLKDYFNELARDELNREKELYLRLRAWWLENDKRRFANKVKQNLSDEEIENLKALIKILDCSNDNDRIMIAEIKRELRDFEGAIEILKKPFPDELSEAASIIRELAQRRDPFVAEMKFEN